MEVLKMRQTENTQKKDNRKSILVIALLLLLVAVIGFGGYTLSKYVTRKNESGSASVAKWGYTVKTDASNLFGTKYTFKDTNSVVTEGDANLTVKADDNATKKVAPGTAGYMTFGVEGKSEVLAQLKVEMITADDVKLAYKKGEDEELTYSPIKWTLKKGTEVVGGLNKVSLEEIKNGLADIKDILAIGEDANVEYTLSWAWDFDDEEKGTNDELDTLLGIVANGGTENGEYTAIAGEGKTNTNLSFELSISIIQLKEAK